MMFRVFAAALLILLSSTVSQAARPQGPILTGDTRFIDYGPIFKRYAGRHHRKRPLKSARKSRPVASGGRGAISRPGPRASLARTKHKPVATAGHPWPSLAPVPRPRPLHPWAWLAEETQQAAISAQEITIAAGRTLLDYAKALYRPAHGGVRLTCGDGRPLPRQLTNLVNRAAMHFGAQAYINSGYRSPTHNRRVGGARNSQHMRCRAVDFYLKGISGGALYAWARRQPEPKGLGRYRGNFIHIDIRPGRRVTWDWRGRRRIRLASN